MSNITAIIQARTAASRLPGKIFMDIDGKPMLTRVVERTRRAKLVDDVVIATTVDQSDDPVERFCIQRGFKVTRGSTFDVLDRYYRTAGQTAADVIVRITADCPLIDPAVVDHTVSSYLAGCDDQSAADSTETEPYDFAANRLPPPWKRTYPIGLDTEVTSYRNLEIAWSEADQPHQREHVMPFFYEQPERFRILHVTHSPDFGDYRWTVDTRPDLELVNQIFGLFGSRDDFTWLEVIDLYKKHPELKKVNLQVEAKDYRETDSRQKQN